MATTSVAVAQGRGKRKSWQERQSEARQCYEMRLSGMRTDQIAVALGISVGTVCNRYTEAAKLVLTPVVEEYRKMEDAKLDALMNNLIRSSTKNINGESQLVVTPRFVEAAIAISKRRADLLGLDAPIKIEQTVTLLEGGIDAEVQKLARELGLEETSPSEESSPAGDRNGIGAV